jgi:CRP-like cAMP-binding protein
MNAAQQEDVLLPCLKSLKLFSNQSNELVRFLTASSELLQVVRGEIICEKGVQPSGLYCVLDGGVKVAVISHHGNERVMEIVGPGGMFGEASMFSQRPCPVYAEALAKSQLVYLRRSAIIDAVTRYPDFALSLFNGMSERLLRLVRDVEICCLQPASDRVMSFLLDNAVAADDGTGQALVQLPAGKAVVASNLNLTPETFSRELHQLAAKGLVQVERRYIQVNDMEALRGRLLAGET